MQELRTQATLSCAQAEDVRKMKLELEGLKGSWAGMGSDLRREVKELRQGKAEAERLLVEAKQELAKRDAKAKQLLEKRDVKARAVEVKVHWRDD